MADQEFHLDAIFTFAKQITKEAGEMIMRILQEEEIEVHTKTSATDLVTQVDQEVERFFISRIEADYPSHTVIGEEGMGETNTTAAYRWYIDPIDGTTNFIHQQINFCISVALYKEGEGLIGIVYDPVRQEMFASAKGKGAFLNDRKLPSITDKSLSEALIGTNLVWVRRTRKWGLENEIYEIAKSCRGIRSLGAAALELAYVAAGRLDGFISLHLSPWDFAAGNVLIQEVGGIVTDFSGLKLPLKKEKNGLLAARPQVHYEILQILNQNQYN